MQKEKSFGEKMRVFRSERGIPVEDLGRITGISASILQAVEMGERNSRFSYPIIQKIADALDVNVNELVEIKYE